MLNLLLELGISLFTEQTSFSVHFDACLFQKASCCSIAKRYLKEKDVSGVRGVHQFSAGLSSRCGPLGQRSSLTRGIYTKSLLPVQWPHFGSPPVSFLPHLTVSLFLLRAWSIKALKHMVVGCKPTRVSTLTIYNPVKCVTCVPMAL